MSTLAGKRGLIVGEGNPHADAFRTALTGLGAEVAVVPASIEPVVETGIDILITCPPSLGRGDEVSETLASTVVPAAAWATRFAAAAILQDRPGVIVHVTGLAGLGGWPGWLAAGTAYAALDNLVRSTAVDLARRGVRVNALVPGVDERLACEIAAASGRGLDDIRDRIPARRFMPEAALTNALIYLVHPSSSYVAGETLVIDGGWNIWGRLSAAAS